MANGSVFFLVGIRKHQTSSTINTGEFPGWCKLTGYYARIIRSTIKLASPLTLCGILRNLPVSCKNSCAERRMETGFDMAGKVYVKQVGSYYGFPGAVIHHLKSKGDPRIFVP